MSVQLPVEGVSGSLVHSCPVEGVSRTCFVLVSSRRGYLRVRLIESVPSRVSPGFSIFPVEGVSGPHVVILLRVSPGLSLVLNVGVHVVSNALYSIIRIHDAIVVKSGL